MTPDQEKALSDFLKWAQAADFAGKLERLDESMGRLYDLFLRENEERRKDLGELRGDIRGVSLRVGELEKEAVRLGERAKNLEKRDEAHDKALETSQSWFIGDLDGRKAKAEKTLALVKDPRTIVAVISALVAAASWLWHIFH
jgi:predicted nuclease with TOPRIM domain